MNFLKFQVGMLERLIRLVSAASSSLNDKNLKMIYRFKTVVVLKTLVIRPVPCPK